MAVLAGKGGKVMVGSAQVAEIDEWSVNAGPNLKDTASFGDSWEEKTALLSKWSGSFKGRFDNTDTNGHLALNTAALGGTSVALKFYNDGTHYWSGTAFVELQASASVTDLVNASYSFTGSGPLTYT